MKLRALNQKLFLKTALIILSLSVLLSNPSAYAEEGRRLIPIGKTVGITAELGGISVVNTAGFKAEDGNFCSPAADAGVLPGDLILKIDGKEVNAANELESITDKSEDREITLLVKRDGEEKEISVSAKMSADDEKYKLGLWVRDSVSGIGTMTYIDPETKEFGALGHGICGDDGKIIDVKGGHILSAEVASVRCGEKGIPGELIGIFSDTGDAIGKISANSYKGIYGTVTDKKLIESNEINVCYASKRSEVTEGKVSILSNVEGTEVLEYSAEIVKINKDEDAAKGMIIKITDERLIEKTGGIVKGMSGSPILQNGKLIGAVTHVFVNDPTRGYGIFIENMLVEVEE